MRSVKVRKYDLMDVLKKNRKEHRDAFLQAQTKYRETAIKVLDEELAAARDGRPFVLTRIIGLIQPSDHTADYDRTLGMLSMHIDEVIELSEVEYRQYVDDDWGWMNQFANEASHYGVSNAKLSKYTSNQ